MKRIILTRVFFLIPVLLFNAGFFLLIENYSATRWCSYAGIMLVFIFNEVTAFSIPEGKSGVVYGYPKIAVRMTLLVLEFVIGIIFMIVDNESWKIPVLVQGCLIGIGCAIYILLMLSEDHSTESEQHDEEKNKTGSESKV